MQTALPVSAGKQGGRRQQLSPLQSAATAADGRPRLHPTTKLILPKCTMIHLFSGQAKLCFIRDKKSNKDFLVDTSATLTLIPFQSAAALMGPNLQAVNKQAIKTWNFMNTAVKFNGREYTFALQISTEVRYIEGAAGKLGLQHYCKKLAMDEEQLIFCFFFSNQDMIQLVLYILTLAN
jgi:hypothetical protein